MISKSKGILTTLPKIATGTCSRRLAVRGPARPAGPGTGLSRPWHGWQRWMAHTVPGLGQCRRRSGRRCRAGGRCRQRQRDAGLGSSPCPRGGDAGRAATAPGATLSQGWVSAGGCSYGLPLPCSTVGTVQVMARADGEGFGGEAELSPQPWLEWGCQGQAASGCPSQGGCRSAEGPARALRPRS